jgi:hypothetical protein
MAAIEHCSADNYECISKFSLQLFITDNRVQTFAYGVYEYQSFEFWRKMSVICWILCSQSSDYEENYRLVCDAV